MLKARDNYDLMMEAIKKMAYDRVSKNVIESSVPKLNKTYDYPKVINKGNIPMSIISDVFTEYKYNIDDKVAKDIPDDLNKLKTEYDSITNKIKVIDEKSKNRDYTKAEENKIASYEDRLNSIFSEFYISKNNSKTKYTDNESYAKNLAVLLKDRYGIDPKLITYDWDNPEKSTKDLTNVNDNIIAISNLDPYFMDELPVKNALIGKDVTEYGINLMLNSNETKANAAKWLGEWYNPKNNPLIKSKINFPGDIKVNYDLVPEYLGQYEPNHVGGSENINLINQDYYTENNTNPESVMLHEISHSREDDIFKNSNTFATIRKYLPANASDGKNGYYKIPGEVLSRINQIRKDAGLKPNERDSKIIKDKLEKYIETKSDTGPYDGLLKVADKDLIIKMLQELANNNSNNNKIQKNIT